ncbi:flagellar motor switch protein FliN [Leptospira sp. GIMC2001]|uniref:flagellar motor switch protein FliN n=1 Tax=Leptospira sp. GIMC2001 TaxID=1513297 RepID=UPI0004A5C68F|nr:flagellar motor switch protein FliN [Leptospira sp. GIMC2001]AID56229.1 flagellar motor switch protein FliN [Leptospira sp. GIMC2001]WCL48275.1 flagellar motor switch protein FliN [Leptospira sp. GIMC2001]
MGEGSLSQDEIDALLQGAEDNPFDMGGGSSSAGGGATDSLSPIDRDIISDTLGAAFQTAGNVLGTILAKNTRFNNPSTESRSSAEISQELGSKTVCLYSQVQGAFSGRITLVMAQENAAKIAGLMMGGASPSDQMDMAQLQTLKDCLSPMMGTITAQLGLKLGGTLSGSPPDIVLVNSPNDLRLPDGTNLVKTQFSLSVDSLGSFKINYILSSDNAQSILDISKNGPSTGMGGGMNVPMQGGMQMGGGFMNQQPQVGIKGVGFPSLSTAGPASGNTNLNLLMDVQMALTVELGRTKMYIKDILGLGEGSIIELDKLAGEPVDLLVNGKLIAKGEVVVIDENFGVRVTDIVSPQDRIKSDKS